MVLEPQQDTGNGSSTTMTYRMVLKANKKELRMLMKKKLSSLSSESISLQSTSIFRSLKGFKAYQSAKRIGIYLSMPTGEVWTDAIVRHALGSGKQVFVPYLYKVQDPIPDTPRSLMEMVDIRSLADYDSLQRDSWGIPTIDAKTVDEREHVLKDARKGSGGLDLILMPGVAFDQDPETGYVRRLGHGKGFYDFFLHRYEQLHRSRTEENGSAGPMTDVLLYGLALREQYLDTVRSPSVPVGGHDSLLHGLVVGNGEIVEGPAKQD